MLCGVTSGIESGQQVPSDPSSWEDLTGEPLPPAPPVGATPVGAAAVGVAATTLANADAQASGVAPAWVGTVTLMGLGLALTATAQFVVTIVQGLSLQDRDTQGAATDLAQRLGFAFGPIGPSVLVILLLVGVILVSLPPLLKAVSLARHQRLAALTLGLGALVAPLVGAGGILTVVYNLHSYTAAGQSAPSYFRLQLGAFLLGVLGPTVVTFMAALNGMGLRARSS